MRPFRVRITTRRLMAAVAVVAVAAWLAEAARRVRDDPSQLYLSHGWSEGEGRWSASSHPAPFWPRYWRRVLGRPWPGSYACGCEFEPPAGCPSLTYATGKWKQGKPGEIPPSLLQHHEAAAKAKASAAAKGVKAKESGTHWDSSVPGVLKTDTVFLIGQTTRLPTAGGPSRPESPGGPTTRSVPAGDSPSVDR